MFNYLSEIFYLVGRDQLYKIPLLFLLFIGLSLLDLIGIALIGPYVSLVIDSSALDGVFGQFIKSIGLSSDRESLLVSIGLMLVSIFFIKMLVSIWVNWKIISFSHNQLIYLRSFLMNAYQSLPYTEFLLRNSSEYVYSILDLSGRAKDCTIIVLRIISDGIVAIAIIGMLAFNNILALLVLACLLGFSMFSFDRVFRLRLKEMGDNITSLSIKMTQGVNESIDGLKEIRILGREIHFLQLVANAVKKLSIYQIREEVIYASPRFLFELLMVLFIVTIVFSSIMIGSDLKTLGPTLAIFGIAALRLLPIANNFTSNISRLRRERSNVSRLCKEFENFQNTIKTNSDQTYKGSQDSFNSLILNKVSFRYPNATFDALKDISLKISIGESIGIIGPTGSGKTTLVDLLVGLLSPQKGEITYNEMPMSLSLSEWRSHVAYLPQQSFLIDDTLRNNIALGYHNDEIDESKVYEALSKAKLMDFINLLEHGIDTVIGERGMRLSGGQRQRVALARTFYHDRSVLIMDESTSALDNETENKIVDEIRQLKGKTTMILIAHRLSTVQHCDRIYLIEDGKIIKNGLPSEILNSDNK